MFDVQWMAALGTILLGADFPWLRGAGPMVLLELVVWLTAAAGVGMLLSWLRGLAATGRPGRARPPAVRATPLPTRREGPSPVPEALAATAALLLLAGTARADGPRSGPLGNCAAVSRTTSVDTAAR